DDRLGRFGVLEVAAHDVRSADDDLAVVGDLNLDVTYDFTDGAELQRIACVEANERRGLSESVGLVNRDADVVEKFSEMARQGSSTGEEVAEPTAQARSELL